MLRKKSLIFSLLIAVIWLGGCTPKKVQTVKIEAEANQIIDVLNENGIRAKKEEQGEGERKSFEVVISGDDEVMAAAIQIMEDHCLGRPEPPEPEGSSIVTSMEVEKAREQRRMKINIESQLRKLPGVTCVDVNFVPPQDKSLAINPYPSTATALVTYKTQTFPVSKEEIASMVAGSVPALDAKNVTVVLTYKPLRQLPDFKTTYNITRIALVSGIGFVTILAFFSIVFLLQKKRRRQPAEIENFGETDPNETALLNENYDFDDDDDEKLP